MADSPDPVDGSFDDLFDYDTPSWTPNELMTIDMAEASGVPIEQALDATAPPPDDPSQQGKEQQAQDDQQAQEQGQEQAQTQEQKSEELKRDDNVTVKLDDGTDVTLADLEAAYKGMHASDGALAVERTAALQAKSTYEEAANNMRAMHEGVIEYLSSLVPAEPDVSLLSTNPQQYQYQKALRDRALGELQGVVDKVNQTQAAAPDLAPLKASEDAKLVAYMPELAVPTKMAEFKTNFMATAKQLGFTEQEINTTADARIFRAIHLASLGMKSGQTRASAKPDVTRQVRTVRRVMAGRGTNNRQALGRLNKTGSLNDAMRVNFDF